MIFLFLASLSSLIPINLKFSQPHLEYFPFDLPPNVNDCNFLSDFLFCFHFSKCTSVCVFLYVSVCVCVSECACVIIVFGHESHLTKWL